MTQDDKICPLLFFAKDTVVHLYYWTTPNFWVNHILSPPSYGYTFLWISPNPLSLSVNPEKNFSILSHYYIYVYVYNLDGCKNLKLWEVY